AICLQPLRDAVVQLTNEIEGCILNKLAIIASLAAGLALQQVANAGAVVHNPITIAHGSGAYATYASGSFHQALLSSDSHEYIGCAVNGDDTVNPVAISCFALNATGQHYAACYNLSPSAALRQAVSGIGEYSYIYFSADYAGHCTDIEVSNSTYNK